MADISPEILSFAVLGHPNEGKSSFVSTLTERDDIRISSIPGETEYSAEYTVELDGKPLIRFIDTPGFQVPKKTLKWLSRREVHENLQAVSEAFDRDFKGRPAYAHDGRILRAVADTSGLLFVVDAAKPLGPDDLAEMEILRLLGKTRMAVLNSKEDDSEYLEAWKGALNRHFNSVRRFNAREAAFDERISLLAALQLTGQEWEDSLRRVIKVLKEDRAVRLARGADIICSLVQDCMSMTVKARLKDGADSEALQKSLMSSYIELLRRRESGAQKELRKLFRHSRFDMQMDNKDLMNHDLFAKETWKVLGLSRRQLSTVSALAGAAAGAAVDLALGEITFGVFMAGGAVLGGVSALAGSRPLSRVKVRIAGVNQNLGRRYMELGPPKEVQLAFILIDRALLYMDAVSLWAHAKREKAEAGKFQSSLPLTRQWSRRDQAAVSRAAAKLIKGKPAVQELEVLREILNTVIIKSADEGGSGYGHIPRGRSDLLL